jgi:CubicO group peptidase (beta-lactamase class C family)
MTPETATPRVATVLDLPAGSPGGSVELFLDLYIGTPPLIDANAFMLQPTTERPLAPTGINLLTVSGKCVEGPRFRQYVDRLTHALIEHIDPDTVDVVHLQHLAFGGTPALRAALPHHPQIALVHGTDLLFAETHPDQLQVLRDTAEHADAIVVPTSAMADRLRRLAPGTDHTRIHHIPWGIPDHLHTATPAPSSSPDGVLRLLYAGRLSAEKGGSRLVNSLTGIRDIHLSIAAPEGEFDHLAPALDRSGISFTYLGWLSRPQLWDIFADHDALVMPSTTLEAMGLVALEAQACGLPVMYQPVPGLRDALGDTALPTDFADPAAVASLLKTFRGSAGLRAGLRDTGKANAARYSLARTAAELTRLGRELTPPGHSAPGRCRSLGWSATTHPQDRALRMISTDHVAELLEAGCRDRVYPGAVWSVGDVDGTTAGGTAGVLDPDRPDQPMRHDTVFDVASLTKVLAVWASIGALTGTNQLMPDRRLESFWPESARRELGQVTAHQLLTHTAGLPLRANLKNLYGTDPAAIRAGVLDEPLHRPPGQAVEYTDRAALILGYLAEHLSGEPLDHFVTSRVWAPLSMDSTRFGPLPADIVERSAPTELDQETGVRIKGTPHDYSARLLGVCGVAGAFSVAADLGLFLQHMLQTGASAAGGFGPDWVSKSLSVQTGSLESSRGYFWQPAPGTGADADVWVHYGFTGTAMWICPTAGRWATLLTNKLYYTRDREPLMTIRDRFRSLVFDG